MRKSSDTGKRSHSLFKTMLFNSIERVTFQADWRWFGCSVPKHIYSYVPLFLQVFVKKQFRDSSRLKQRSKIGTYAQPSDSDEDRHQSDQNDWGGVISIWKPVYGKDIGCVKVSQSQVSCKLIHLLDSVFVRNQKQTTDLYVVKKAVLFNIIRLGPQLRDSPGLLRSCCSERRGFHLQFFYRYGVFRKNLQHRVVFARKKLNCWLHFTYYILPSFNSRFQRHQLVTLRRKAS